MERKTILIANYSQQGSNSFPEDTWKESTVIYDEKSLLRAMKEWYKTSASSFANYPLGGLFSTSNITFSKKEVLVDDDGKHFYAEAEECLPPEYWESARAYMNELIKGVFKRLPRLRNARRARLKKESELRTLNELMEKYNQNITG